MTDIVKYLEEILSDEKLEVKCRSLLLLNLCQLALVISQEVAENYWKKLKPICWNLPGKYKKQFKELKVLFEKPEHTELKGFIPVLLSEIDKTFKKIDKSPEEASKELKEHEENLRKRWWPFGKSAAWIALVKAWIKLDRKEALNLIKKIPRETLKNFLIQWNKSNPLSKEEWELVQKNTRHIESILEEILLEDFTKLSLPEEIAKKLGERIKKNILFGFSEEEKYEKRIDEVLKYRELVQYIAQDDIELTHTLMKNLYSPVVSNSHFFKEKFPSDFILVADIINVWADVSKANQDVTEYIFNETPYFLCNFALAQWYGITSSTLDEAKAAYKVLMDKVTSKKAEAEAWFLVVLVKSGLCEEALRIAENSSNKKDLIPRLRRAILVNDPERANELFKPEDFKEDLIDEFLMYPFNEERFKFLRDRTKEGSTSLPKKLWEKPNSFLLNTATSKENKSLMAIYSKHVEEEGQFEVTLRLYGYGYYSHEEIDLYLLAALAFWNEQHPKELQSLMKKMWSQMKPSDFELQIDLIRNHIFERCRTVLAAHPETLAAFISSIKSTLVDKSLQWGDGQTTYTLSLPDTVPFVFALLAAEKVANLSPRLCDEILINALKNYKANDELMISAAKMYAFNKGLDVVEPPTELNQEYLIDTWRIAVVEATFPKIARDLMQHYKLL